MLFKTSNKINNLKAYSQACEATPSTACRNPKKGHLIALKRRTGVNFWFKRSLILLSAFSILLISILISKFNTVSLFTNSEYTADMSIMKIDAIGNVTWHQTYGGTKHDQANSLVHTVDGGFALAGTTESFGTGEVDMWLVKTDVNGMVTWSQTYGGIWSDSAHILIQTADGGFALAGSTESFGTGKVDMWLVKTDANGVVIWSQTYGGTERDVANVLIQTVDGGFALAGHTESFSRGNEDMWLMKTDITGKVIWQQTYGGTEDDSVRCLIQTADGGFLLGGSKRPISHPCCSYHSIILIKTDTVGDIIWNQTITEYSRPSVNSILETTDDGFLVAGTNGEDILLIKFNINGVISWNQTYGGKSWDKASTLIQISDNSYLLAGWTESYGVGGKDMYLVKIKPNSLIDWEKTYGGTEDDAILSAIRSTDGGFILAGYATVLGVPQISFGRCVFWFFSTGIIVFTLVFIRFFTLPLSKLPIRTSGGDLIKFDLILAEERKLREKNDEKKFI